MANGSFGLSGIPTAPTTVGSAPNNPLSPVSAVVNSTAGFQAGDLIYNFGGDIAPPPGNYVSTGTFPITDTAPTVNPNTSYGELFPSPITKGVAYQDRVSAKLTDGNIVVVYLLATPTNVNRPFFKVVSESGAVVVTDTQISTIVGTAGNISVCALTGGGFAVGWRSTSTNNPYYAIYANPSGGSCATVLTATQDTGITLSGTDNTANQLVARPDGSWIFAVVSNTTFINHKVFSATGVQVYNWTQAVTASAGSYWFKYAVRSDNTFIIFSINGSSQVSYTVYSATNTVAKATANITPSNTPATVNNTGGVSVFSNDTTILTFASGNRPYYVTVSNTAGSNTAGTATAYTFTGATSFNWWSAKPKVLANGNYIVSMIAQDSGLNKLPSWVLSYIVFNSSHVAQTEYQVISSFSAGPSYSPDILETTNFIHLLGAPAAWNSGVESGWDAGAPCSLQWAKVSPSTYLTVKNSSISLFIANSSAQSVSGYARSGSTPTTASFFASTSGTVSTTQNAGAVVVAQTTIDTAGVCYAMDTASLSDGSCLILYRLGSGTFPIKLAVISPAGALTATYTVVASASTSASITQGNIKLAVLTDGKIAILYSDASSNAVVSVLSSTYSVLTTPVSISAVSGSDGTGLTSLSNGRFAVAYRDSATSHVYYRVYDSSLTLLAGPTAIFTGNTNNAGISCASYPGGFLVNWSNVTSGVFFSYSLIENTTNSFQISSGDQYSNSGARINGQKMVSGTNGNVYSITYSATGALTPSMIINVGGSRTIKKIDLSNMLTSSGNTTAATTFALTSYNEPVVFSWGSSSIVRMQYNTSSLGIGSSTYFEFTSVFSYPASTANNIMVGGTLAGHNVVLALLNSSNFLTYAVINPTNYTYSTTLTAGVTPSNTTAIGLSNGFSLVGVSSTAAPANGQGTVVINGPAQLNSSYPASTTGRSFSFQNPVTFGAAGTISGRNVNLIGNV